MQASWTKDSELISFCECRAPPATIHHSRIENGLAESPVHLTFHKFHRGYRYEHTHAWSFDLSTIFADVRSTNTLPVVIFQAKQIAGQGFDKASCLIDHLEEYKKGVLRSQSINFTIQTCLTSQSTLPDNVEPKGQTRERCLHPAICSKALVGYSNWRYHRSPYQSKKGLSQYNLVTDFCIWLPLSLIVTVEQIDESNKKQQVCSSSTAFHTYYISDSGGRRFNASANSVMVSTPSNHRARATQDIILLMKGLSKCEPNWAKDRIWSGGLETRLTFPD